MLSPNIIQGLAELSSTDVLICPFIQYSLPLAVAQFL